MAIKTHLWLVIDGWHNVQLAMEINKHHSQHCVLEHLGEWSGECLDNDYLNRVPTVGSFLGRIHYQGFRLGKSNSFVEHTHYKSQTFNWRWFLYFLRYRQWEKGGGDMPVCKKNTSRHRKIWIIFSSSGWMAKNADSFVYIKGLLQSESNLLYLN